VDDEQDGDENKTEESGAFVRMRGCAVCLHESFQTEVRFGLNHYTGCRGFPIQGFPLIPEHSAAGSFHADAYQYAHDRG
jgi:hypothetical protein